MRRDFDHHWTSPRPETQVKPSSIGRGESPERVNGSPNCVQVLPAGTRTDRLLPQVGTRGEATAPRHEESLKANLVRYGNRNITGACVGGDCPGSCRHHRAGREFSRPAYRSGGPTVRRPRERYRRPVRRWKGLPHRRLQRSPRVRNPVVGRRYALDSMAFDNTYSAAITLGLNAGLIGSQS